MLPSFAVLSGVSIGAALVLIGLSLAVILTTLPENRIARLSPQTRRTHIAMAMHLASIVTGVLAAWPETPIDSIDVLNALFGMPLILGGLIGIHGAYKGIWYSERAGLSCEMVGLAMRAIIIVATYATHAPYLETFSRATISLMLLLGLAYRQETLKGLPLDPLKWKE